VFLCFVPQLREKYVKNRGDGWQKTENRGQKTETEPVQELKTVNSMSAIIRREIRKLMLGMRSISL